ncbi:MAG: transporter, partial [Bacteroidaceae bacterium]|nr:transporter [Bacteroidaceae bacterium]
MKKIGFMAGLFVLASLEVNAGGLLTNTNQSISFLRNPAREGVIGIDGVYTNPAGVAFMNEGFHLSLNWQYANQTRTATTVNPLFKMGVKNNGNDTKTFEGTAKAPCIPSVQAAYNKGKWSYQFNFAVAGGGGKCEYANGVGSFESVVGQIAGALGTNAGLLALKNAGLPIPLINGYDNDGYMQGRQYYFGFTLGAAYKVNENLAVYGGLRALYGDASYRAKIENLRAYADGQPYTLTDYFTGVQGAIENAIEAAIRQGESLGATREQVLQSDKVNMLRDAAASLQSAGASLAQYSNGVNLQSDQEGFGVAPIIGVDYKFANVNIGAKYEFRTRIAMKNKSTVRERNEQIPIINEYADGSSIRED